MGVDMGCGEVGLAVALSSTPSLPGFLGGIIEAIRIPPANFVRGLLKSRESAGKARRRLSLSPSSRRAAAFCVPVPVALSRDRHLVSPMVGTACRIARPSAIFFSEVADGTGAGGFPHPG